MTISAHIPVPQPVSVAIQAQPPIVATIPTGAPGAPGQPGPSGLTLYASPTELDDVRDTEVGVVHFENLSEAFPPAPGSAISDPYTAQSAGSATVDTKVLEVPLVGGFLVQQTVSTFASITHVLRQTAVRSRTFGADGSLVLDTGWSWMPELPAIGSDGILIATTGAAQWYGFDAVGMRAQSAEFFTGWRNVTSLVNVASRGLTGTGKYLICRRGPIVVVDFGTRNWTSAGELYRLGAPSSSPFATLAMSGDTFFGARSETTGAEVARVRLTSAGVLSLVDVPPAGVRARLRFSFPSTQTLVDRTTGLPGTPDNP